MPPEGEENRETKTEDEIQTEINKIGFVNLVTIVILHFELNVIGVEKRKAVVILALEGKEVIAEDRTIDPNEGQAIMENDVKIQGVDSIVQITEGILEVVVAQTTLEIEIDVD